MDTLFAGKEFPPGVQQFARSFVVAPTIVVDITIGSTSVRPEPTP